MVRFLMALWRGLFCGFTGQFTGQAQVGAVSVYNNISRSGDVDAGAHPVSPLETGKAGVLTTRTSDAAGMLTVATGHGIVATDVIAIWWAAGRCHTALVDSVTELTITFSIALGDVLPIATTAIVVGKMHSEALTFSVAALQMFIAHMDRDGIIVFQGDAEVVVFDVVANEGVQWAANTPAPNPLEGVTPNVLVTAAAAATKSTTDTAQWSVGAIF